MSGKYSLGDIHDLQINIKKPCIIFLYGDLGAGKTTLSQSIINKMSNKKHNITSPTYVYYNKYKDIYHFDLYRCSDYDEFVSIGGEEILDNNEGIIIIEWPELIEGYYNPDIKISLKNTGIEGEREIILQYF